MKTTHHNLILIAAVIWYCGGIALLLKGGALIKGAYLLESQSNWTFFALFLGIIIGLLKGAFIFSKSCRENIKRIKTLSNPKIWQFFRPGMMVFLAVVIPTGAWMSKAAAGKYTLLCLVGALDLSIAFALLYASIVFWKLKVFSV